MTPIRPASTHAVQAIQNETRLFQALRDALKQQRAAVAASDPGALDAWTNGIARLLNEIEAADRYRQKILAALAGGFSGPAADGDGDPAGPPALSRHPLVARARIVFTRAARKAATELVINRTVMTRAIEYGDGLLRTLMAGPAGTSPSSRGYQHATPAKPAAAMLLNRVV